MHNFNLLYPEKKNWAYDSWNIIRRILKGTRVPTLRVIEKFIALFSVLRFTIATSSRKTKQPKKNCVHTNSFLLCLYMSKTFNLSYTCEGQQNVFFFFFPFSIDINTICQRPLSQIYQQKIMRTAQPTTHKQLQVFYAGCMTFMM